MDSQDVKVNEPMDEDPSAEEIQPTETNGTSETPETMEMAISTSEEKTLSKSKIKKLRKKKKKLITEKTASTEKDDDEGETPSSSGGSAYLPGMQMEEGEILECDESAYITLHTFSTKFPCLSFDIIPDSLGDDRRFPWTSYIVGGTQAQRSHSNSLIVMKLSNVYKTQPKSADDYLSSDESENESDEDEKLSKKPELDAAMIPHHGCVNRVKFAFVSGKPLAASWSELGKVAIWDLSEPLTALESAETLQSYISSKEKTKPIFSFSGHRGEGYAVHWSPTMPGFLATGDSTKFIHIWRPHESSWIVDQRPFASHHSSVEDIQWSPNEQNVFASCSSDKSIKIWDARAKATKGPMLSKDNAHSKDVNVIHWNRKDPFLASGGDDCSLKVWDLRNFDKENCVAEFTNHHKSPITSIEWNPFESTVFASAGEDDQVAFWDLAVEADFEAKGAEEDIEDIPPQLLFVHQGQQDIKELHWHPQIPGAIISTSATGFNIFKPENI